MAKNGQKLSKTSYLGLLFAQRAKQTLGLGRSPLQELESNSKGVWEMYKRFVHHRGYKKTSAPKIMNKTKLYNALEQCNK